MWRSLEMWMQSKGLGSCARKLLQGARTVKSMDVIVPVKREETEMELCLRTVARPDEDVATLLAHPGLSLYRPKRTEKQSVTMIVTFIKSVIWWKMPFCSLSNGVVLQPGMRRNYRLFWQLFKSAALCYGSEFRDDTL
jgi:hypothetical protein